MPERERLFLALWPDADTRSRLARIQERFVHDGRRVPVGNLHLTLRFLGAQSRRTRDRVAACLADLDVNPFTLELDRLGLFRRAGVVWFGCAEPPPALVALRSAVDERLAAIGMALEYRPFHPHVTLARRAARRPSRGVPTVGWSVGEMRLVRSRTEPAGAVYDTVARWSFGTGETGGYGPSGGGTKPPDME